MDTVDNGGDASDAIEIELGRANTGSDSAGECEVVFSTLDGEDGKEATVFGVAG
ncbi:hypothetical protein [Halovivax sp.]|uniref:hypothetical protein n=1 Tax=Halovivax sp. TaxID=1935978 RepID=UPI0025B7AFC9|nr:hypothetical protein [Halovivax sp.]